MSFTSGGSTRWMSPELLNPEDFGDGDSRPTKQSDRYALGMVIYEVYLLKTALNPYVVLICFTSGFNGKLSILEHYG